MLYLQPVAEPGSKENKRIIMSIMNSHPSYNRLVLGKALLTSGDIERDIKESLELGASSFYIKNDDEPVGLIDFLPENPRDKQAWIGLLIVHKNHEGNGIGSEALRLLEEQLLLQKVGKVRLGIHKGNDSGTAFWRKHGYINIKSTTDKHQNQVDIYEKVLKE